MGNKRPRTEKTAEPEREKLKHGQLSTKLNHIPKTAKNSRYRRDCLACQSEERRKKVYRTENREQTEVYLRPCKLPGGGKKKGWDKNLE